MAFQRLRNINGLTTIILNNDDHVVFCDKCNEWHKYGSGIKASKKRDETIKKNTVKEKYFGIFCCTHDVIKDIVEYGPEYDYYMCNA